MVVCARSAFDKLDAEQSGVLTVSNLKMVVGIDMTGLHMNLCSFKINLVFNNLTGDYRKKLFPGTNCFEGF